jgi:hypothetical protein
MPGIRSCQENHQKITSPLNHHKITKNNKQITKINKSRLHSITTKSPKIINKSPKSTNHVGAGWVCPDEGLLLRLVVEAEEKPGPVQLDSEDCRGGGG